MDNDFVIDFMLPMLMLGGFFMASIAVVDCGMRVHAWWKGEKYESPWVW